MTLKKCTTFVSLLLYAGVNDRQFERNVLVLFSMTGYLGDLAKPIPTRSLTLRYFVHFPPDPDVLSLALFLEPRGSYGEAFVSIFRRNKFKENRVSMIFLEERATRGKSNGRTIQLKMIRGT